MHGRVYHHRCFVRILVDDLFIHLEEVAVTGLNNILAQAATAMLAQANTQYKQAEAQIRLTVRHLIEAGATKQEIAEAIAQMGLFAGMPAMTKAMGLANEVLEKDETE